MPVIRQCFFESEDPAADLERQLYLMRKRVESRAISGLYFCSLSSRVLVYKGLLTPLQLRAFYSDLAAPDFTAPFAIFHQRYSTNTSPSWQLAQPFRYVAHNGEINTISANRRWTSARESTIRREFAADENFHVLEEGVSDSASFDNVLEVFLRQNYNVAAAMLRMVPPAWESDARTFVKLRSYLEKAARRQEPWDGPAALVFSDGQMVGAKLDRNGLRPMRYVLTSDGLLVVGSEVGLADLRDKQIIERNRLGPGEILLSRFSRRRNLPQQQRSCRVAQAPMACVTVSRVATCIAQAKQQPRCRRRKPPSRTSAPPQLVRPRPRSSRKK